MAYEEMVRVRAYALWEQEGRPYGREVEHWRVSEEVTLRELSAPEPASISEYETTASAAVAAKPKHKSGSHKKANVKRVVSHAMAHAAL